MKEYENFIFYGSFLKTIEAIPDKELQNKVLMAIIRYGCAWEVNDEEPMVNAFLQLVIPTIEKQKDNYAKGSKGGRPVSHTQEEYNKLFDEGKKNKEVEEILGVSSSTVERKKKIWREIREIEKEKEKEREKEKESGDMGVLGVPQNTTSRRPSFEELIGGRR